MVLCGPRIVRESLDIGRMVELSKNWKNVKSQEEYSKIIIHRANKNAHLRTGLLRE